jgi:hypothetical protein
MSAGGADLDAVLLKQEREGRHKDVVSVGRGHCGKFDINCGLWRVCAFASKRRILSRTQGTNLHPWYNRAILGTIEHAVCKGWSSA